MLHKRIASVIAWTIPLFYLPCSGQADLRSPSSPERIQAELRTIENAAAHHATDVELGELWGLLGSDYESERDIPRAEEAYGHALKLLRGSATAQNSYASVLDGLGSLYLLKGQITESENCRRKALAILEGMGDRARSLALHNDLAVILLHEGKYKDSENEASKAIDGMLEQAKPYAADLVSAFITRGFAKCRERRCNDGVSDAERAVDIVQAFLPSNSLAAASSRNALGFLEWKSGDVAASENDMRRALQILNDSSDIPHPILINTRVGALKQYQQFLAETHRKAEAHQFDDEITRLTSEQAPMCRNCTVNVDALASAPH